MVGVSVVPDAPMAVVDLEVPFPQDVGQVVGRDGPAEVGMVQMDEDRLPCFLCLFQLLRSFLTASFLLITIIVWSMDGPHPCALPASNFRTFLSACTGSSITSSDLQSFLGFYLCP